MNDIVDTQSALDNCCSRAATMPWVGFDTEFERIRTYYPKLCLVQMSTPETTVCIDPLVGLDLTPLCSLLASSAIIKVFHAARQDLEVMHVSLGISPAPLFDTQIAAQLCGYRQQSGYAELAKKICQIDLPKKHTRTAWCRRPLSHNEIEYALDDARYLGAIYYDLKHQLQSLGRDGWVSEDCKQFTGPGMLVSSANRAIYKIQSSARGLDQKVQSIAFQLALWREETAQSRDRPREWILSSKTLLTIAKYLPSSSCDLEKIADLSELNRRQWGAVILSVVEKGVAEAPDYEPLSAPIRASRREKLRERKLWERLNFVCQGAQIPTAAVAGREDIRKLARGNQDVQLLSGWRHEFVGRDLYDLAIREGAYFAC